jgi:adenine-specific DNA-methyltransferase
LADYPSIGFENHLNYFYGVHKLLDEPLALGLAIYLNSTLVDSYFRQFSGHTQVNATDLRNLRYPTRRQLRALSEGFEGTALDQQVLAVSASVA